MKSYLKLLLALLVAICCIVSVASCALIVPVEPDQGNQGDGTTPDDKPDDGGNKPGSDIEIVVPDANPVAETYLVDFVYRYHTTYINDFNRMESKEFNERSLRLEIPVDNSGFTAENIAAIAAITHNGYGFASWHAEWNDAEFTVAGDAYEFVAGQAPITSDMTFYAYRGNLAGTNATWEIYTEGEGKAAETVLKISGEGSTFDFTAVTDIDIPWYSQRSSISKVVVDEGITRLGSNTFHGLFNVDIVEFPESLVELGESSLRGWTKLKEFVAPKNLKVLGVSALAETNISKAILNEGLEEIKESAFLEALKLKTIIVPSTLKVVGTAAFHPGVQDSGSLNASSIEEVFSLGTQAQFKAIDIGLDNSWFNELASVYYTPEEGCDPTATPGPYWHYIEETGEPVPYYFLIQYYLNKDVYGTKTPVFLDYVPVTYEVKDGVVSKSGTVTAANEAYPDSIVYHGFKFVRFQGAVKEGSVITSSQSVTCETYVGSRITPTSTSGKNQGYLSNGQGIAWEYDFATKTITVTVKAKSADLAGVTEILKTVNKNATVAADSSLAAVLGISTQAELEVAASMFASVEEFTAFANMLVALEVSASTDPLIATAEIVSEAGIATAEELAAFVAELEAYEKGEAADAAAVEAKLAATTLDAVSIKALAAKVEVAGITGNIGEAFEAVKTSLEAFEKDSVSVSDAHAKFIAREEALINLAELTTKFYSVGDAEAYDSCETVGDLVAAIESLQDEAGIFKTFDYESVEDTAVMWASGRSYARNVQKLVIEGDVTHIGKYAFAGLPSITEVKLPASVKTIDITAFDGCAALNSIYFDGANLADCKVVNVTTGEETNLTLANDRALTGHYATAYAKAETPTAAEGGYWYQVGDKAIAWNLTNGKLTVGGAIKMADLASPEAAPWYGAKDSITSLKVADYVTHVSENLVNGYDKLENISFGKRIVYIPESAFAGTAAVLNKDNYSNGLLIINDCLIASDSTEEFIEIPYYTIVVAEGALSGCTAAKSVYVPGTVQGVHPNAFVDFESLIVFYDRTSDDWKRIAPDLVLSDSTSFYVCVSEVVAEEDKDDYFTFTTENGVYVPVGCLHVWGDYTVETPATCEADGLAHRTCVGECKKTIDIVLPALGHAMSDWVNMESKPGYKESVCTNEGCDHREETEVIAVEGFDGVEIPDTVVLESGAQNNTTIVAEGENNVLVLDRSDLSVTANKTARIKFLKGNTADPANITSAVFEADVKLENELNKTVQFMFQVKDSSGNQNRHFLVELACIDGVINLQNKSHNTDSIAVHSDPIPLDDVKYGEWFKIRLEYFNVGETGAACKVYINNNFIVENQNYYGVTTDNPNFPAYDVKTIDCMYVSPYNSYQGKLYFDNVSLYHDDLVYVDQTIELPEINFDDIAEANKYFALTSGSLTESSIKVTADGNKYYSVTRTASNPAFTINPMYTAEGANAAFVEFDMMMAEPTAGSQAFSVTFYGGECGRSYMLEFRFDKASGILYLGDKSESADSKNYKSGYFKPTNDVKLGDWFNVRVEYYQPAQDDAGSVRMLTYINDELILYSNNWYGVTTDYEASGNAPAPSALASISHVQIFPYTSHRGEIALDNLTYYNLKATAPTDPVTLKYSEYEGGAMNDSSGNVYLGKDIKEDDRYLAISNVIVPELPEVKPDEPEETPELTVPEGAFTFDQALEGSAITTKTDSTTNSSTVVTLDDGNKVLRVTKDDPLNNYQVIQTGKAPLVYNTVIFETRMAFDYVAKEYTNDSGATKTSNKNMEIALQASDDTRAFESLIQFNSSDKVDMVFYNKSVGSTSKINTEIGRGEYFTFRIVYSVIDGVQNTQILLNGEQVLNAPCYTAIADSDPKAPHIDIASAIILNYRNFAGTTDIDYMYLEYKNVIADGGEEEAPEENETEPVLEGTMTFDEMSAMTLASGSVAATASNNSSILPYTQAASMFTASIIDESGNKFIRIDKTAVSGTSSSWVDIYRPVGAPETGALTFETKARISFTETGGGIYFRAYTDRSKPSGGSRIFNDTIATKEGCISYAGVKTHAPAGEWFTMRWTYDSQGVYTFYVLNETDATITRNGVDYAVDEWVPYYTKTYSISVADISCTTFMQSTGSIVAIDLDNVYLGDYVAPIENPIGKDPIKDKDLPEGTITFNGIKDAELPSAIEFVGGSETTTLGALAISNYDKVLEFVKGEGNAYFYVNATDKDVAANQLVFETQLYISELSAPAYIDFTLAPSGAANADKVIKLRLIMFEGQFSIAAVSLDAEGNETVGTLESVPMVYDEWFKISIVYTENEKVELLVDDQVAYTATSAYGMFKDASAISQVVIAPSETYNGTLYLENVSVSQVAAK